jgi:hypothetical protein
MHSQIAGVGTWALTVSLRTRASVQVPCSPGINPECGDPGGSEFTFYNQIIRKVRETQPQVVLSGEDCANWNDAIKYNFQLPGTKAGAAYHVALAAGGAAGAKPGHY